MAVHPTRVVNQERVVDGSVVPLGYKQITDLSSAVGLDEGDAIPTGATMALLQAEAKAVRFRDDGQDPTASVGMVLADGAFFTYTGDLAALKVIETDSGAKLNVSFYAG